MNNPTFSDVQKQYLHGFTTAIDLSRQSSGLPPLSPILTTMTEKDPSPDNPKNVQTTTSGPDALHHNAQNRFINLGKKLAKEEMAKRDTNALDLWNKISEYAQNNVSPKGTDVLLYKSHGLFHVAPTQDSFMCRLRFPGGATNAHQFHGMANIAEQFGGGYTHLTTRGNLQIREITPPNTVNVLTGLHDLGVVPRGSGGDNIRNITANPTAGFDPQELIDTLPLAKQMHHHIMQHRELYGLPRKFNIAFEGSNAITALADTNDIEFRAVTVDHSNATEAFPPGVYFRLGLGGITGHKDFARDTGLMLKPEQCVPMAHAIIRVFIDHGDRTNRNKARLKYLLDDWGFERFLEATQEHLPFVLPHFDINKCDSPLPHESPTPVAHIGFHPQKQTGKHYVGVVVPVGKLTVTQMRDIANIATRYGNGDIRMTVWQNLLIPHINDADIEAVKKAIETTGLHWSATNARAGLVACTGNAGCKFAAANTKVHALRIADHLDENITLDQPVNIHLTGCHHSCAQHYIGDIGLIATPVEQGDDTVEGYDILTGGGFGENQHIGRRIFESVPADQAPQIVQHLLASYQQLRLNNNETFQQFSLRHEPAQLRALAHPSSSSI